MEASLELNLIKRVAVGDIFRRSARRWGGKTALVEYRGSKRLSYTYSRLNGDINRFARGVRSLGLVAGDRVAAICLNSLEYAAAIYGLAKGGYVCVPVNPGLSPQDIVYIVNHSEARVLVVDDMLFPLVEKIKTALPKVEHYVVIKATGSGYGGGCTDFDELLASQPPDEVEDVEIGDNDTLQIMYTSGTTAAPKGVVISHLQVYISSLANISEFSMRPHSVISAILPMFHCAQHAIVTSGLLAGSTVVVMRMFSPDDFLQIAHQEKMTMSVALPLMYRLLLDNPSLKKYDLSSLAICMYAMTPMDKRTLRDAREAFGSAIFVQGTGQTEAYPATNSYYPELEGEKEGNFWGTSVLIYDTEVMDDEGNILDPGKVGEIVWRSPAVMQEYYRDPESTREARKYGWHHSGDLGYFDHDGMLVFLDRKKDMIKTGGENVPSIKVERAVLSHPGVEAAAAVGIPHPRWIEAVTIFVVPRKGQSVSGEDLIKWCRQELGSFEVPKSVIFVDTLPRTTTGKIRKNILRDEYKGHYLDAK